MKDCFETPFLKDEMYSDDYQMYFPERESRGDRASLNYLQALQSTQTVIDSIEKNDLHETYSGLRSTLEKWDLRIINDENLQRLYDLANEHLQTNPEDPEALFIVGYCHAMDDFNTKQNLEHAEQCLKLNVSDLNFQFNLGMALAYDENYEKAAQHFRIAFSMTQSGSVHLPVCAFYLALCRNLISKSEEDYLTVIDNLKTVLRYSSIRQRLVPKTHFLRGMNFLALALLDTWSPKKCRLNFIKSR